LNHIFSHGRNQAVPFQLEYLIVDRCRDSVAWIGFTTTYKVAGTAKVPPSRTRHRDLWVGLWVGNLRIAFKRAEPLPSSGRIGFLPHMLEVDASSDQLSLAALADYAQFTCPFLYVLVPAQSPPISYDPQLVPESGKKHRFPGQGLNDFCPCVERYPQKSAGAFPQKLRYAPTALRWPPNK